MGYFRTILAMVLSCMGEDAAGGVIRGADDDRPGAGTERRRQPVEVELLPRGEGHIHRAGVAQDRIGPVILIKRLKNDDFLTRVHDGKEGRGHGFGRAASDCDLRHWIDGQVVPILILRGQGVPQAGRAPGDGVLVDVVPDRASRRFFQDVGAGEVGEALREIDGLVLVGEARHPADHRFGEAVRAAGGAHAGKDTALTGPTAPGQFASLAAPTLDHSGENTVSLIDAGTFTVFATLIVGPTPKAAVVPPGGISPCDRDAQV